MKIHFFSPDRLWSGEIQGTVHRRLLEERAEELQVGAVLLLKQVSLAPAPSSNLDFYLLFWTRASVPCGQVGVFSPSHRNHYLNVTPNNLLRIYSPDGVSLSSTQPLPLVLVRASTTRISNSSSIATRIQPVYLISRSRTPPPPSGSLCLGCSWSLTRRMRKDGRSAQTRLMLAPEEAYRSLRPHLCPNPAGSWVRTLIWTKFKLLRPTLPHLDVLCLCADDDLDELLGELPEDDYSIWLLTWSSVSGGGLYGSLPPSGLSRGVWHRVGEERRRSGPN